MGNKKISLLLLLLSYSLTGWCDSLSSIFDIFSEKKSEASLRDLVLLINSIKEKDDFNKIKLINSFFNDNIRYKNDIELWGKEDYWATPIELLNRGLGDCEDYAIAKYYTLVKVGLNPDRLRITYVYTDRKESHMVLYYLTGSGAFVLDNIDKEIKSVEERKDLYPVFSFNEFGAYYEVNSKKINTKLFKWEELKERILVSGW